MRRALSGSHLLLALWSLALFAVCWRLDIRHDRFPYYYHPDEPGKVNQVITGDWNYHHPMLLLMASKAAAALLRTPNNEQAMVETGRRVSAGFMAMAVVAFSLSAYLWRGWIPALATGMALGLHHQLYELVHYMKEDSALLMGAGFTVLAALAFAQAPSRWRALLLGTACGLAISGKYVGVTVLLIALPTIWRGAPEAKGWIWGAFILGITGAVAAINLPMLVHLASFRHSLEREVSLVVGGQGDVTRRVPHPLYWNVFLANSTPAVWVLLLLFLSGCRRTRARLDIAQRMVIVFPFALALGLSFSPKENDRYFLPASAFFTMLACLGIMDAPRLLLGCCRAFGLQANERPLAPAWRRAGIGAAIAAVAVFQLTGWSSGKPGWLAYDAAFQHDDVADFIEWMRTRLPATAKVAADARVQLPDASLRKNAGRAPAVPQAVVVSRLAADLGSLQQLRAQGFTHVAVSESSYGRFFRNGLFAKEATSQKFAAAKLFYEEILRGQPLFDREKGTVIYLHPGIRVYSIPDDLD